MTKNEKWLHSVLNGVIYLPLESNVASSGKASGATPRALLVSSVTIVTL